ncbi:hypothetical protein Pelo_3019 [Pelomyxa schiedti]|nr:hypothetical protein Pelo_3019 [Pelomyxa schiedti]
MAAQAPTSAPTAQLLTDQMQQDLTPHITASLATQRSGSAPATTSCGATGTTGPRLVFTRIYRASDHNFASHQFHGDCDDTPNLLVVVRTEHRYLCGGFTGSGSWRGNRFNYSEAQGAFLFSAYRPGTADETTLIAFPLNPANALYSHGNYGPTFGNGHDLYITHLCNANTNSYSRFPYACNFPATMPKGCGRRDGIEWDRFLCGAGSFKVLEYEVYEVTSC